MAEGQTKVKTMTGANSGGYSRFLSFHGRNPDVLNSIANLSNDEVFTPPEFANRMLDTLEKAWAESNSGENIWSNPNLKFLDPFTKSGVFLREIASRLISGLESEIPDLQKRVDHILTNQVFGIATTRLTSLMARRSLYCSKKANGKHSITKKFKDETGNIWFEPMPHTWKKGTIRELTMDESGNEVERYVDGKCSYCGASKRDFDRAEGLELHAYGLIHTKDPKKWVGEIFGDHVQFDVIIGNPPYQLNSAGTSDEPVYQDFVVHAMALEPRFLTMVTPSRWFTGGKGLSDFRSRMIADRRLQTLVDFPDSKDTFPGVEIKGGVSYFLWNRDSEGDCKFSTVVKGAVVSEASRDLRDGRGVVVRDNLASSIIEKFMAEELPRLSSSVSPQTPFGIYTNFAGWTSTPHPGDVRLYKRGLEEAWVSPGAITARKNLVPKIKVLISYGFNGGDNYPHQVTGKPILVPGNSACTQTYFVAGSFDDIEEASCYLKFLQTRIVRFLVLQRKISQHTRPDTFAFVPKLPMNQEWDDDALRERFSLTSEEFEYICTRVKEISDSTPIEDPDGTE
jgi:site-specific DNA-methyltransferase (adenine-specific)